MQKRNRIHLAAARQRFCRAHDILRRPIAAFHQNIGLHRFNQRGGRVVVKPSNDIHTRQRSGHGGAVGERINRPIIPFALAAHGSIGVERQNHGRAGGARLRQIGNMAAVQNIEAAIGKHQRARQSGQALGQVFGRADFVFEIGQQPRLHDKSFQIKGMAA